MVMGFGSCLFECGNPNNSESAHDLDFPGAAVDDLGKRDYAALLSSRPTGSFRATPPPASYTTSRDAPGQKRFGDKQHGRRSRSVDTQDAPTGMR